MKTHAYPLFYADAHFVPGQQLILEQNDAHHLQKSLRAHTGDTIEVTNGKGFIAEGCISALKRNAAIIDIKNVREIPPCPTRMIMGLGLGKWPRMEDAIEKLTEMAIGSIWIYQGEFTGFQHDGELNRKHNRILKIMIEAMKQAHHPFLPDIRFFKTITSLLDELPPGIPLVLPNEIQAGRQQNQWPPPAREWCAIIGPPGGFSCAELAALKNRHAFNISLGPSILRSETAAVATAAIMQQISGNILHCWTKPEKRA